jgi:hypothetical protein
MLCLDYTVTSLGIQHNTLVLLRRSLCTTRPQIYQVEVGVLALQQAHP